MPSESRPASSSRKAALKKEVESFIKAETRRQDGLKQLTESINVIDRLELDFGTQEAHGRSLRTHFRKLQGQLKSVMGAFYKADGGFLHTFLMAKKRRMKFAEQLDRDAGVETAGEEDDDEGDELEVEDTATARRRIMRQMDEISNRVERALRYDTMLETDMDEVIRDAREQHHSVVAEVIHLNEKAQDRSMTFESWKDHLAKLLKRLEEQHEGHALDDSGEGHKSAFADDAGDVEELVEQSRVSVDLLMLSTRNRRNQMEEIKSEMLAAAVSKAEEEEQHRREAKRLEEQLQHANHKLAAMQKQFETEKRELLDKIQSERTSMSNEVRRAKGSASRDLDAALGKNKKLEKSYKEQTSKMETQKKQADGLEKKNQELKDQVRRLTDEISVLESRSSSNHEEMEKMENMMMDTIQSLMSEAGADESENALQKQLVEKTQGLASEQKRNAMMQIQVEELRLSNQRLLEKTEQLERRVQTLNNAVSQVVQTATRSPSESRRGSVSMSPRTPSAAPDKSEKSNDFLSPVGLGGRLPSANMSQKSSSVSPKKRSSISTSVPSVKTKLKQPKESQSTSIKDKAQAEHKSALARHDEELKTRERQLTERAETAERKMKELETEEPIARELSRTQSAASSTSRENPPSVSTSVGTMSTYGGAPMPQYGGNRDASRKLSATDIAAARERLGGLGGGRAAMGAREGERTEHVGPFLTEVRTLGELEGAKARAEEDARSMREEEERGLLDSQKLRAAIETGEVTAREGALMSAYVELQEQKREAEQELRLLRREYEAKLQAEHQRLQEALARGEAHEEEFGEDEVEEDAASGLVHPTRLASSDTARLASSESKVSLKGEDFSSYKTGSPSRASVSSRAEDFTSYKAGSPHKSETGYHIQTTRRGSAASVDSTDSTSAQLLLSKAQIISTSNAKRRSIHEKIEDSVTSLQNTEDVVMNLGDFLAESHKKKEEAVKTMKASLHMKLAVALIQRTATPIESRDASPLQGVSARSSEGGTGPQAATPTITGPVSPSKYTGKADGRVIESKPVGDVVPVPMLNIKPLGKATTLPSTSAPSKGWVPSPSPREGKPTAQAILDPRHAAAYGGQHRIPSSALSRSTPFSPGPEISSLIWRPHHVSSPQARASSHARPATARPRLQHSSTSTTAPPVPSPRPPDPLPTSRSQSDHPPIPKPPGSAPPPRSLSSNSDRESVSITPYSSMGRSSPGPGSTMRMRRPRPSTANVPRDRPNTLLDSNELGNRDFPQQRVRSAGLANRRKVFARTPSSEAIISGWEQTWRGPAMRPSSSARTLSVVKFEASPRP